MAQSIYGDVSIKGKVVATAATASGELATKGQVDAAESNAKVRSSHTGTQPSSTISDFSSAVQAIADARISNVVGAAPAAFDTLQEIAEWVTTDEAATTTLLGRVDTVESDIATLQGATSAGGFKATIGDNSASSFTVNHDLNTTDVIVEVVETSGNRQTVFPIVTRPSVSSVFIDFAGTVVAVDSHRVLIRAA